MRWRVACALVPDFVVNIMSRQLPLSQRQMPLAIVEAGHHRRVKEVNQTALNAGIRPGYSASRAQALCPDLLCLTWQAETISHEVEALIEALSRVSPIVQPLPNTYGRYWLDARGMSLLGGEVAFVTRAIETARQLGFEDLRIGIADTLQMAEVCALKTSLDCPFKIISTDESDAFMEQLPLEYMSLDDTMAEILNALGIKHVHDLKRLPKCALTTRFGQRGARVWDEAHNLDPRRLNQAKESVHLQTNMVLETPVSELGSLIFGVNQLADDLGRKLSERNLATHCVGLTFLLEDRRESTTVLHPSRPLQTGTRLFELVRDRLERQQPELNSGVIEVRLTALETAHRDAQQIQMGTSRWDQNAIEKAMDRLSGRFNEPVVYETESQLNSRPEHKASWVAVDINRRDTTASTQARPMPRVIRRQIQKPVELRVRGQKPSTPDAIQIDGRWHPFNAYGPERLSGDWWQSEYAYEDYRLVTRAQEVFWVRYEPTESKWTIQGWFD
ncbi:MAG: DNA polymerase Y family protein [Myxococcota bacterium]|nr:DNA polymerase Y family protein [Myxococcota bacterium]